MIRFLVRGRISMESRIDRREFLGATLALGAAASACRREEPPTETPPPAGQPISDFELDELTVRQLQAAMEEGRLTARRITELYLERIEAIDKDGEGRPGLRSVIEVNPEALSAAEALDRERKEKGPRGPLHGIPVLLKDNVGTADRMTTTAGSLALEGSIPERDSFVAERLRAAGSVLLAKVNLSEWANFRSTHSSSGWSARGGQCRNPYVLDRNPCGSSSGSGAATSANLGAVSIGTETDGSIVCPSNANGLVGFKPTVGLVSRAGIIPVALSQDTAGPMTRTVEDTAIVLGALTGIDPRDAATSASEGRAESDYTRFLDTNALSGKRLGVARSLFGFHPGVDRVLESALEEMKRLGAELIDPVELPDGDELQDSEMEVLLYEFKAGLNAYLAELSDRAPTKTLADIIAFNEANREREMPYFEQEIFVRAEAKGPLTEKTYLDALARNHRIARDEGIDKVMRQHRLSAIVAPTGGPAWTTDLVNGDHFSGGSSSFAAIAGYPDITVPAGDVQGLPVGISFFAGPWSEPVLLGIAYAFEQATKFRRKPAFLASV
jgi:amidase